MITLSSTTSTRALHLHHASPDCLHVVLSGTVLSADTSIWLDENDAASLSAFFADLDRQERPWQGERTWQSIEGDFKLAVTCSALGAVRFHIALKGLQGSPEEWQVTAGIESEFGQLARIAEAVAQMKTGG